MAKLKLNLHSDATSLHMKMQVGVWTFFDGPQNAIFPYLFYSSTINMVLPNCLKLRGCFN